ncbi:aspartate/glutamate racemase family protein [Kiloniella sp. b19]|uniref:aspartate/glutamate racemase family protein n=1 Tax=Kiloniella sp. GXU_MW_B19 TaxID=3141326 RepID=UPI0031DA6C50
MKTIGLIGGMSWESTVVYYQHLNRLARSRLGGLHSASLLLRSFDFAGIEALQAKGDWESATRAMIEAARSLERGGAECLLICTNTMHLMADAVQNAVDIPLIHIADVTADAIKASACKTPLLLATRYTMEQGFYRGRLRDHHGIASLVPEEAGRQTVHDIIYQELCQGIFRPESKQRMLDVVRTGLAQGADSVILGCTEVGLLLSQQDMTGSLDAVVLDTTLLHAEAALDFALKP